MSCCYHPYHVAIPESLSMSAEIPGTGWFRTWMLTSTCLAKAEPLPGGSATEQQAAQQIPEIPSLKTEVSSILINHVARIPTVHSKPMFSKAMLPCINFKKSFFKLGAFLSFLISRIISVNFSSGVILFNAFVFPVFL